MQTDNNVYECAVIGGGLAGLSLAIQLADRGISTVLFEKNTYPFHKVCGEYISMESWNFLLSLGLPLHALNLPVITEAGISSQKGFMLNTALDLGGFGISRHTLDNVLYQIAKQKGVTVLENCKVLHVTGDTSADSVITTSAGIFSAQIVCGSYGKYTPVFAKAENHKKENGLNYIGVKYHVKADLAANRIELHNFQGGYCGISKIDADAYCLCYLANAKNLKAAGNDIRNMETQFLFENPYLKKYFTQSEFLFDAPVVISNITFNKKSTCSNGIFLLGDAAGSITPLCGNGMSMALRASNMLAVLLISYFEKNINKQTVAHAYEEAWAGQFNFRILAGYYLQGLFGKKHLTHLALKTLHMLPAVTKNIIRLTHGKPF